MLLLLAPALPLHGEDFRIAIDHSPTGAVLSWPALGSSYAYAAQQATTLGTRAWKFIAPVDQWPSTADRWHSGTTSPDRVFYRVQAMERGGVVSSALLDSMSVVQINLLLTVLGIPIVAQNGISAYRITYETFDHRGLIARASGALVVPNGVSNAPLVSYQHGTLCNDADALSLWATSERMIGVAIASDGYAVAMPDYIGIGTVSTGLHPYVHTRSEAVACVDMLRASSAFIASNLTLTLNGQLFLVGYSQGGHATAALHRELERYHTNEFKITASAPMAGPYDLSDTMRNVLLAPVSYSSPSYLPYVVLGYDEVYGFDESAEEIFVPPYSTNIASFFDGSMDCGAIDLVLPAVPSEALQAAYLAAFTNNVNHPLRVALRENDVYDWAPVATTRLYHCSGDTTVPLTNSQIALSYFLSNGAVSVQLIDPSPGADHADCAIPAALAAKAWFDSLKEP